MRSTIFFALLLACSATAISAQKTFYGTVEYAYEMQGEGAEMMAAFLPEKMVIKYGDKSMMTTMEGGMMGEMMGRIIVNGQTGESFVVKESEQAVYLMKEADIENAAEDMDASKPVKGEGTMEILGYSCQKYKLPIMQDGQETMQYIWITEALKAPQIDAPGMNQLNNGPLSSTNLPGFPLRVEVAIPQTGMMLTMMATKLDDTKVDATEFERPKDYEVKDFSEMMGGK